MKKSNLFFTDKKTIILIIIAIAGILLTALGGILSGKIKSSESKSEADSLNLYITDMEKRLCETVSGISGAGKTKVFINAENSFETVYATNASIDESGDETKNTRTTQKELVRTASKTEGEVPVVVKQICPKISGVLIVCEGGNNPTVRQEITNSVSTAFNIATTKIYVTGGES